MTAPLTPDERRRAHHRAEPFTPEQLAERQRIIAERRARGAERSRQYRASLKAKQAQDDRNGVVSMACPNSPEPDGYHRFRLKPHGLEFETCCVYCGAAKLLKPFDLEDTVPQYRRQAVHGGAKRPVIGLD
jgi:hypothetical protein